MSEEEERKEWKHLFEDPMDQESLEKMPMWYQRLRKAYREKHKLRGP